MIITATQMYTRQAPRKVRLVANTVRKLSLRAAFEQLSVMPREASIVVMKTLRQAVANAVHNHNIQFDELSIKSILVDEGPRYKRFRAVSRGRAHTIIKRTSHISVELQSTEQSLPPKEVAKPIKAATETEKKVAPAVKKETIKKTTKKVTKPAEKKE